MAKTNRNKLAAKYNALIEAERQAFLLRTGKKIARGFYDTDEYKDLARRKKRALRRQELRQEKKKANKIVEQAEDFEKSREAAEKVKNDLGLTNLFVQDTNRPYYSVLGYNEDDYTEASVKFDYVQLQGIAKQLNKDLKTSVYDFTTDTRYFSNNDENKFDRDLKTLFYSLNKYKEENPKDYPDVSWSSAEDKKNLYLILISKPMQG